jgi:hypothetical protein
VTQTRQPSMPLREAAEAMTPPIPRRELARRLSNVPPVSRVYGRRGRRAAEYPIDEIMRAHAEWVRDRMGER